MERTSSQSKGIFFLAFFGMLVCYIVICLVLLVVDRMSSESEYAKSRVSNTRESQGAGRLDLSPPSNSWQTDLGEFQTADDTNPLLSFSQQTVPRFQDPVSPTEHATSTAEMADRQSSFHSPRASFQNASTFQPSPTQLASYQDEQAPVNPVASDETIAELDSSESPPVDTAADREWLLSLDTDQTSLPGDMENELLSQSSELPDNQELSGVEVVGKKIAVNRIVEGSLDIDEMYGQPFRSSSSLANNVATDPTTQPETESVPIALSEPASNASPPIQLDELSQTETQQPFSAGEVDQATPQESDFAELFANARPVKTESGSAQEPAAAMSIGDSGVVAAELDQVAKDQPADQITSSDKKTDSDDESSTPKTVTADQSGSEIIGWPLPESLLAELDDWGRFPLTSQWAEAARTALENLNELRIDNPDSLILIDYCKDLAVQLNQHANSMPADQNAMACRLSRLAYRIRRRTEIWRTVHQVARMQSVSESITDPQIVAHAINNRQGSISFQNVSSDWAEYLMLDRAAEIFADTKSSQTRRTAIARRVMARVTSPTLTDEQVAYAQQLIGNELGTVLRAQTTGPIQLGKFLVDLEAHEAGNSSAADARINFHFQNFYWHHSAEIQQLAEVFDNHYRNANCRIEVSEKLINRIAPRNMTYHEPVEERILGAQVFGQSRIQNNLRVELIPDAENLSFRLVSRGNIRSRTLAHSSGFVFNSLGNAMVNASKGISINPNGVSLMPANVQANSQSRLLGIRSQLDGVPLVGRMARRLAEQQQQSQTPQANSIVEQRLRTEVGGRIDEEVQQKIGEGRQWIARKILNPLSAMELEPGAISTETTPTTAVVRYRLAGLDQNASNTARPQGLPDSLLNAQIHESAVNNLLNRIQINGRSFTAPEFMQHLADLLGRPEITAGEEEHQDVKFQFAARDGIRLDFEEDRVAITLKLKQLQIGSSNRWRNLIVTAWYYPRAIGLHIDMILDEKKGVSVEGRRTNGRPLKMRDQLAVRTVFNTLFQPHFEFPMLPPELANRPATQGVGVSQIVLADGWAGISVSDVVPVKDLEASQTSFPVLRNARQMRNRWR